MFVFAVDNVDIADTQSTADHVAKTDPVASVSNGLSDTVGSVGTAEHWRIYEELIVSNHAAFCLSIH